MQKVELLVFILCSLQSSAKDLTGLYVEVLQTTFFTTMKKQTVLILDLITCIIRILCLGLS